MRKYRETIEGGNDAGVRRSEEIDAAGDIKNKPYRSRIGPRWGSTGHFGRAGLHWGNANDPRRTRRVHARLVANAVA